jgi:hypothetical protein
MTQKDSVSDLAAEVDRLRKIVFQLQRHAIAPIAERLCYDTGEGPDHWGREMGVAMDAANALDEITGEDPNLQYEIGLRGLRSPWRDVIIWGIKKLGNSGRREAIEPLRQIVRKHSSRGEYAEAATEALLKLGAVETEKRIPKQGDPMNLQTTQIEIPHETVELLGQNAAARNLSLAEYLRTIAENDSPPQIMTFDEILAPFSAEVEASGITDDDLDDLIQTARREVHKTKQRQA